METKSFDLVSCWCKVQQLFFNIIILENDTDWFKIMSVKPDSNIELTWTVDAMMTQAKSIYIIFDDQRKQIVFFFRRGIFLKKYKHGLLMSIKLKIHCESYEELKKDVLCFCDSIIRWNFLQSLKYYLVLVDTNFSKLCVKLHFIVLITIISTSSLN